jgi:hypothetical protein
MPQTAEKLVWYVAYGSNLNYERFCCYILGGRPQNGLDSNPGCQDKTLPRASRQTEIPYQLYFGGTSAIWGGGIAYIEHTSNRAATKCRAYLITEEQFWEVVGQENLTSRPVWHDIEEIRVNKSLTLTQDRYGHIIHCGDMDGWPMLTFTCPTRPPFSQPSAAYLQVISDGLKQTYGLSENEIANYLADKPGINGEYLNADELINIAGNSPAVLEAA